MKFLIALLLTCSSVLGQGFGSFSYDQPFLAKSLGYSDPTNIAPAAYWWVAEDLTPNTNVYSWRDRIAGAYLFQTNSWNTPTNSSFGVCFDGNNRYLYHSNYLTWTTNSSVMLILSSSSYPRAGIIFGTNTASQYAIYSDTNFLGYNLAGMGFKTGVPLTNTIYDVTVATDSTTNNIFTNGVFSGRVVANSSNQILDVVGGRYIDWAGSPEPRDGSYAGYIREILMWTNHTITTNEALQISTYKQAKYGPAVPDQFFNPYSIANLQGWIKADSWLEQYAREQVTNNGHVSRWASAAFNKPGTPYAFSSGGDWSWQYNSGPNNRPSLDTGYSSGHFGYLSTSQAQPNTFFVVAIRTNTTGGQVLIDGDLTTRQMFLLNGTTDTQLYAGTTANLPYAFSCTNWTIYTICFNTTSSFVRTNGVLLGTGSPGAQNSPGISIGDYAGGSFHWRGRIAELLYYHALMNTNDMQTVENYLKAKYAL